MEKEKLKKAIIFDCDNTLWRGVVGEGEIVPNTAIQQDIVMFAKRGVIIGLCSKNNEEEVISVLQEQTLTEEFISVKRLNWKDKASNLKEIAQELNIGLDALVFVDDSEFEVNLIKKELPEVLAIYPEDLLKMVNEWFDLSGDITKTRQYKENYQRTKAQEQFTDINDYLASLDMVLTIKINDVDNSARIAELTQKTNQFNLTTMRNSERHVRGLMPWVRIYSLSVRDKFGDSGITGVCMVSNNTITEFLLSCRILGRGIEFAFMDWIIEDLKKSNHHHVFGKYLPTKKNIQVESFYPNLGFEYVRSIVDEKVYYIDIDNYKPHAVKHFRYE
jgi:FkbH-like protein